MPSFNFRSRRWLLILASGLSCVLLGFVFLLAQSSNEQPRLIAPGTIAFTAMLNQSQEVFQIQADAIGQTPLTFDRSDEQEPAWSPDGHWLAFVSDRNYRNDVYGDIFLLDLHDHTVQQLTHGTAGGNPSWSPDSKYLAYRWYKPNGEIGLYTMQVDGSHPQVITQGISAVYPVWSPNGKYILFVSELHNQRNLYRIRPDGTDLVRVTSGLNVLMGAWSPDSTRLVFTAGLGVYDIYTSTIDGQDIHQLTTTPQREESFVTWSPDGDYIAFTASSSGGPQPEGPATQVYRSVCRWLHGPCGYPPAAPNKTGLYVMRADGSQPTLLTDADVVSTSQISWFQ